MGMSQEFFVCHPAISQIFLLASGHHLEALPAEKALHALFTQVLNFSAWHRNIESLSSAVRAHYFYSFSFDNFHKNQ